MHKYLSRLHIPHGTLVAVCWISSNEIEEFTYYIIENTECILCINVKGCNLRHGRQSCAELRSGSSVNQQETHNKHIILPWYKTKIFPNSSSKIWWGKRGSPYNIMHKVQYVLYRYFPENWQLWMGIIIKGNLQFR